MAAAKLLTDSDDWPVMVMPAQVARTTAATANGASTIVLRGTSGEFSAGAITGAFFIGDGSNVSAINGSNVTTGTVANARTTASSANGASTIVLRDASGAFSAGIITADGSGLSAINASNISSGTIANARTTANSANGASTIVARDANGSFTANVGTFTSISGNGVALTAINASNISSGTLDNARTTANTSNGANTIVLRNTSGNFAANEVTANIPIAENGLFVNKATVGTSYTIGTGYNAVSAGTVTVNNGVTVTVSSGSRWVVV